MSFLFVQFLTVLASASSLFLVASGLTLIFGVTRVVNFAHGSLYMLGAYCGYRFVGWLAPLLGDGLGFLLTVPLAAFAFAALGIGIEVTVLRRFDGAPELLPLPAPSALLRVPSGAHPRVVGTEGPSGPGSSGRGGAFDSFCE